MSLNIEIIKTPDNDYIEVKLIGEVDIFTSPEFKNKLMSLIESDNINILIDGEGLEYIDSTGLGVLMGIYKKIHENNLKIKIKNLRPNIYKLFDITGLNKVFEIQ